MIDDPTKPPTDPVTTLWVHCLRAQLDAVVTGVEAQIAQHVAAQHGLWARSLEARTAERDALARALDAGAQELAQARAETAAMGERAARAEAALGALQVEHAGLVQTRDGLVAQVAALHEAQSRDAQALHDLRSQLGDLGERVVALDEQFAQEKAFVEAALSVRGEGLFDALQQHLGTSLEASPGCYGALKARKPDAVLLGALRERGRSVQRDPLSPDESEALEAIARAAGCALVTVSPGTRFNAAQMERASTRSDPAEEGNVLECVLPGLRLAGSPGSLLHPRVVVATG